MGPDGGHATRIAVVGDSIEERSQEQERVQQEKWREMLGRVRTARFTAEPDIGGECLATELDFIVGRTVPADYAARQIVLTVRELILGRYHRFGADGLLSLEICMASDRNSRR